MPQASDDLRDLMKLMFGEEIDETGPMNFLESRGYKMTQGWEWQIAKDHWVTEKEDLCIRYLIDEWDFGGLKLV